MGTGGRMAVLTTQREQRLPLQLILLGVVGFLSGAQSGFTGAGTSARKG